MGPNSGYAAFDGRAGTGAASFSRASRSCCAFNDKDNKEENSKVQDENKTNLRFMRTPAYDGYDLFRKDKRLR